MNVSKQERDLQPAIYSIYPENKKEPKVFTFFNVNCLKYSENNGEKTLWGNKMKARRTSYIVLGICMFLLLISFTNCDNSGSKIEFTPSSSSLSSSNPSDPTDTDPADTNSTDDSSNPTNDESVDADIITSNNYKTVSQTVNVSTQNKVDVLVVIDNSGSMGFEQSNMSDRFNKFLDELKDLDWQIGIITTDVSQDSNTRKIDSSKRNGRFLEFRQETNNFFNLYKTYKYTGKYILNSKTEEAQDLFSATIQRENEIGDGDEQGIAATYQAIERSQESDNTDNSPNVNFFRSDSTLAVIVVSDENETGSDEQNDPDSLIEFVNETFPNKNFVFHSIIIKSDDKDCLDENGTIGKYGVTYEKLSEKTGGLIGSVCEEDYSSQLSEMGKATVDIVNEVTLECAPVAKSDGTPDLEIETADKSTPPSFQVKDKRVSLSKSLPAGQNIFKYKCSSEYL